MELQKKIEGILKGGEGSGWFRDDPETPHVAGAKAGEPLSYEERQKAGFTQARKELKENFPKTKFSVRKDRDTMNVAWTDGPAVFQVDKIVDKFEGKSFDGMQDLESYTPAHDKYAIGYVFTRREVSKENMDKIYEDYAKSQGKEIRNPDGTIDYSVLEDHPTEGGWGLYETAHRIASRLDLTNGVPEDKSYIYNYYKRYSDYRDKPLNKQLYVGLLDIIKGGVGSGRRPSGHGEKVRELLGAVDRDSHKALDQLHLMLANAPDKQRDVILGAIGSIENTLKEHDTMTKGGVGSGRYPKGSGKKLLEERLGENHKALGMEVDKVHEIENGDVKHTIVRMKPREGSELTRHYLIEEHKDDPKKDLIHANSFLNGTMIASQGIEHVNPNDIKEDAGLVIPARIGAKEYTARYGKGTLSSPFAKGGVGSGRYPAGSGKNPKKEPSKAKAFFEQDRGKPYREKKEKTPKYKEGEQEKLLAGLDNEYGRWVKSSKDRNNPEYHEALGRTGALLALNNVIGNSNNKLLAVHTLSTMIDHTKNFLDTHPDKVQHAIYKPYLSVLTRYKDVLEESVYGNG